MDFMSFLRKPCQNNETNLEELKQHTWVQKLFLMYNSIILSSGALERSIPLSGIFLDFKFDIFVDDIFVDFL